MGDVPNEERNAKFIWRDDPRRDERLFDWLDTHNAECKILFASGLKGRLSKLDRGGQKSKKECCIDIAKAVFLADEDSSLRNEVTVDAQRCGTMVSSHFVALKRTYQQVNERIGKEASNMKYEDLDPESSAFRNLQSLLEPFPLWKRLHLHWRTRPFYNQFWSNSNAEIPSNEQVVHNMASPSSSQVASGSSAAQAPQAEVESSKNVNLNKPKGPPSWKPFNIAPPSEVIVLTDNDNEDAESTGKDVKTVVPATPPVENISLPRRTKRPRKRKRRADSEDEEQPAQAENNQEDAAQAEPNTLSVVQIHERELAEIAYKRQKLENEALEKRTAAEIRRLELEAEERRRMAEDHRQREKERHEFLMKMIEMGLPGLVGQANAKPVPDGESDRGATGNGD